MSTINLNNIINKHNLAKELLARELFPDHKHPILALTRVCSGKSYLDTNQLSKLSEILNVSVLSLFEESNWVRSMGDNIVVFSRNNYRVELEISTHISKIYVSNKLVAVETLITDKNIKLSEYLKLVEETIINLI